MHSHLYVIIITLHCYYCYYCYYYYSFCWSKVTLFFPYFVFLISQIFLILHFTQEIFILYSVEPNCGPLLPMFKYCLIFRMQILPLTFVKYICNHLQSQSYGCSQMRNVNIIVSMCNTANDALCSS